MHRRHGQVGLLWMIAVSLCLGGVAFGDVVTERSGSIVVFPKVISGGTRDTIIRLTNTSNSMVRAHCFYVNAALSNPDQPPGPLNPPLWQEVDFDITLTKQQPTHWTASAGRRVNPFDPVCSGNPVVNDCDGAGFDPGLIPPVLPGFTGELKCIEVDDSGAPLSGNHLKGEAMLVTAGNGDVSTYNALAILGNDNNGDGVLVLGGGQCVGDGGLNGQTCRSDDDCGDAGPCALEYNACPQAWILNHQPDGAPELAIEAAGQGPSMVETQLTFVPCTQNFETQEGTRVTLQFLTTDEFESQFSTSTTVDCWGNFFLAEMNAPPLTFGQTLVPDPQGTMFLKTRIRSAGGTPFGVLMVAEEFHFRGLTMSMGTPDDAAAAMNVHVEGERANPDIITIPQEQLAP